MTFRSNFEIDIIESWKILEQVTCDVLQENSWLSRSDIDLIMKQSVRLKQVTSETLTSMWQNNWLQQPQVSIALKQLTQVNTWQHYFTEVLARSTQVPKHFKLRFWCMPFWLAFSQPQRLSHRKLLEQYHLHTESCHHSGHQSLTDWWLAGGWINENDSNFTVLSHETEVVVSEKNTDSELNCWATAIVTFVLLPPFPRNLVHLSQCCLPTCSRSLVKRLWRARQVQMLGKLRSPSMVVALQMFELTCWVDVPTSRWENNRKHE